MIICRVPYSNFDKELIAAQFLVAHLKTDNIALIGSNVAARPDTHRILKPRTRKVERVTSVRVNHRTICVVYEDNDSVAECLRIQNKIDAIENWTAKARCKTLS